MSISIKAQTSEVYWDQVINSKLISSTSFEPIDKHTFSAGYSVNELAPNEDGKVEVDLYNIGKTSILALTAKRTNSVSLESGRYSFKNNLDFYIQGKPNGYEVNGKLIPTQVSEKDKLQIKRLKNSVFFLVNGKVIQEIKAESSHLYPLVVAVVSKKGNKVTGLQFSSQNATPFFIKSSVTHTSSTVMGTISIEVYGKNAPYTYNWEHTKENTSKVNSLKQGNYTVTIQDTKGQSIKKTYQIDTEVELSEVFNTSVALSKNEFYTVNDPLVLQAGNYIGENQKGEITWNAADVTGKLYVGLTTNKEVSDNAENNLLYAFLLENDQIDIFYDGKILHTISRSKNRNTTYTIEKDNEYVYFRVNTQEVFKQKNIKQDVLYPKAILLDKAKITKLQGNFTGFISINKPDTNRTFEQKITTAYFKEQKVTWLSQGAIQQSENQLAELQDGWIKWNGTPTTVWLKDSDKNIYKFDATKYKGEVASYSIRRSGYSLSFYKNDVFQYAIFIDANKKISIESSQTGLDIMSSFGACTSPFGPTDIWHFGEHAGLDFTRTPPEAIHSPVISTNEGCGIVTDNNGELLFYTDGRTVWDKAHNVLNNGTGLKGHSSTTQTGLVVPDPGNENRYYIFHATAIEASSALPPTSNRLDMYYSIVEFNATYPQGTVIQKNTPLNPLATPQNSNLELDERLTVVKHKTLNAYWIVTHRRNTNKFISFLLGETGFIHPVTHQPSPTGANVYPDFVESTPANIDGLPFHFIASEARYYMNGQFKFSPNGKYLAVACSEIGLVDLPFEMGIYILPFDDETGQLSNVIYHDESTSRSDAYGIEFSPNGKYLYAIDKICAGSGGGAGVHQYDLENLTKQTIATLTDQSFVDPFIGGISTLDCIGSLQLAKDGKIYVARAGKSYLGIINFPNAPGINAGYQSNGVNLDDSSTPFQEKSRYGLPSFVQSFLPCPSISFNTNQIQVIAGATSQILSVDDLTNMTANEIANSTYEWSTGETTPSITVTASGTYKLIIKYNNASCDNVCSYDNEVEVIFQNGGSPCENPLEITDIFSCDTYTLTAQDGFTNYQWNTGEQGQTLIVHSDGEYSVTAFDAINNCIRKGVFYASSNDLCYEEKDPITTVTTAFNEVLSVSVVNYSDSWLKLVKPNNNQNPFLNAQKGVWRADASFAYMQPRSAVEEKGAADVDLSKDGTFNLKMLNWGYHGNLYSENWRKVATLEQYNAEGFEVENRDILGRYSSALYGYHNQLSTAVATNARYSEIAYEGFEEYNTSKIKSADLTTSNFDILTFSDDESLEAPISSYRHYNIVWAENNGAIDNTATVEVNTGRPFLNTSATLKVVPISTQLTQVIQNVPITFTPHTSRTWKASNLPNNLPAKWKGSIAFSTEHKVVPLFTPEEIKVEVAQDYGHTGKKSLLVTGNAGFEQFRFDPLPGRSYIVSLWVSVKDADVPTFTSDNTLSDEAKRGIKITFEGSAEEFFFEPTGRIIEGWQRIEGTFCVPQRYEKLIITLQSGRNETTYFDDMRLHPFDGNIQTYVYDPNNYLLRAVLDRNNFATFYYYDSEQQLRLVKKETERGVKTIQEVGNNMPSTK